MSLRRQTNYSSYDSSLVLRKTKKVGKVQCYEFDDYKKSISDNNFDGMPSCEAAKVS